MNEFEAIFGNVPEQNEEEKAQHEAFMAEERKRIVKKLVLIFANNINGIVDENPELKYFGDAPNYFAEYYLNEEVWNAAKKHFLNLGA